MNVLLLAITVVTVVALLVWLIGVLLPRSHRATSRIRLTHPPAMVWATVRNQAGVASWWREVKQADRLPDQTLDSYLSALARHFGEAASPIHLS
jgi:hypothetical protein